MRQVFYIEADEEMISVIGRLRKSSATENIIVAPYRSLILQSIVNLRLLNHDARKNGKEIIVVTQDEQSRSLCEKAGIRVQSALDGEDVNAQSQQRYSDVTAIPSVQSPYQDGQQAMSQQQESQDAPVQEASSATQLPHSDSIGSADFFAGASMGFPPQQPQIKRESSQQPVSIESLSKQPSYDDVKRISIRDNNPKKLTSLNSSRFEEEAKLRQQKSFTPPSLRGTAPVRPVFAPLPPSAPVVSSSYAPTVSVASSNVTAPQQKNIPLKFLSQMKTEPSAPLSHAAPEKPVSVSGGGKMKAFFIFFGFISVLSVGGVGAYIFLPKADVQVKLKVLAQKSDFEFDGSSSTTAYSSDLKTIPVRLIEKDQEVSLSFDATGKASLADQKARGSVTLYNEYSVDPQLLVASTRLLSEDGKVFRLLSGVTVPGMTTANGKVEPGVVEATVTADQSGSEYNVAPTSFTIPGFQSGPKYDKFYGKSSKAMNGGGTSGSDVAAVSDEDVAAAKKAVEAKVKAMASDIANQEAVSGEKILDEAVDASIVSSGASPQSGAVTDSFDYRVKLHVKALAFSETDLKKMIGTIFAKQNTAKGIDLSPSAIDVQYGEPTADFAAGTLRIKAHAVGHSESSLDESQLKSDLLGQDESAVTGLLQKYDQIDTISIALWPEFIATKIPTREDRVTVTVESIDAEGKK